MIDKFQAVVIGGGPGGYVCAIRLAQLGLKTACIESRGSLGGTCLNVGCIPSKALLDSSEHYHQAKEQFSTHGIGVGALSLDFPQMVARKGEVVSDTTAGIDFLMKKNSIDVHHGLGSFLDANTVQVTPEKVKQPKSVVRTSSSQQVQNLAHYHLSKLIKRE